VTFFSTLKPHWKIEFQIHSRVGIYSQLTECITCESYSHVIYEYLNTLNRSFHIVGHPKIRFTCNEHNKTRYFARHLFFMLKDCYGGAAGRIERLGCLLNARVAAAYRDTSCTRYVLPFPFFSFSIPSYSPSVSSQVSSICLARFSLCLFCSFACRRCNRYNNKAQLKHNITSSSSIFPFAFREKS